MKHVFILNPMAGSGTRIAQTREMIEKSGCDCIIYETLAPRDATRFVREYYESCREEVRFYACGGDGTLKEVAEGMLGCPNASLTCYPIGSGNDFVKYYGGAQRFADIGALMHAADMPIDIIRVGDEYSLNICNFGFDACVAKTMAAVRRKPLIGGRNAYTTGILNALLRARKNKGVILADGERISGEDFLLCTIANGSYVGGAYYCAPRARNDDGLLEVCLAKPISVARFASLVGTYRAGTHLADKRFADILTYRRAKRVEVSADEPFAVSLDGEIIETAHFVAEVVPHAIRFAVPGTATNNDGVPAAAEAL